MLLRFWGKLVIAFISTVVQFGLSLTPCSPVLEHFKWPDRQENGIYIISRKAVVGLFGKDNVGPLISAFRMALDTPYAEHTLELAVFHREGERR